MRTLPTAMGIFLYLATSAQYAGAVPASGICGNPNGDGEVTATDALIVLHAAVGLGGCTLFACDTDGSGQITAKDSLMILRFAVANPVSLNCPPTSVTSSTIYADECFEDDDCDPGFGQAGPYCCGYHCCECDNDDSQCDEGEHCEGEICVPDPSTVTSSTAFDECFYDDDCNPEYGQAGPYCCGYHCCECDADDSQCGEGEHCEGEVCVPDQPTATVPSTAD